MSQRQGESKHNWLLWLIELPVTAIIIAVCAPLCGSVGGVQSDTWDGRSLLSLYREQQYPLQHTHCVTAAIFDGLVSCVLMGFVKGFFVNVRHWFNHVTQGTSAIFALHEKQRAS